VGGYGRSQTIILSGRAGIANRSSQEQRQGEPWAATSPRSSGRYREPCRKCASSFRPARYALLAFTHVSPIRPSASLMVRSSRNRPAASTARMTSDALGTMPRFLARRMTPSVPKVGMPAAFTQFRAAASSRIAVQGARSRANAKSAVSPPPRPHSSKRVEIVEGFCPDAHPPSIAWRPGSEGGPASNSCTTGSGTTSSSASSSSK